MNGEFALIYDNYINSFAYVNNCTVLFLVLTNSGSKFPL